MDRKLLIIALILPDAEGLGRDLLVWLPYVCAADKKHVRQHAPTPSRYDEMRCFINKSFLDSLTGSVETESYVRIN